MTGVVSVTLARLTLARCVCAALVTMTGVVSVTLARLTLADAKENQQDGTCTVLCNRVWNFVDFFLKI